MAVTSKASQDGTQEYRELRQLVGKWDGKDVDELCEWVGHGAEVMHHGVILDRRGWAIFTDSPEIGQWIEWDNYGQYTTEHTAVVVAKEEYIVGASGIALIRECLEMCENEIKKADTEIKECKDAMNTLRQRDDCFGETETPDESYCGSSAEDLYCEIKQQLRNAEDEKAGAQEHAAKYQQWLDECKPVMATLAEYEATM